MSEKEWIFVSGIEEEDEPWTKEALQDAKKLLEDVYAVGKEFKQQAYFAVWMKAVHETFPTMGEKEFFDDLFVLDANFRHGEIPTSRIDYGKFKKICHRAIELFKNV